VSALAVESEYIGAACGANDVFDIEVAIKGLLADPTLASMKLPRTLSSEQRKHVKKIVEQHHELKCESFGLGEDRQMHLFKRNSGDKQLHNNVSGDRMSDCSPQSVRVKNTFIDDWIQTDGMPADGRIVQSMPHNMFAQRLSAEMSGHVTSAGQEFNEAHEDRHTYEVTTGAGCRIAAKPGVDEHQYALGTEVVIDGLVKAPMFNGASGIIQSWDADSQRYDILLTVATSGGQRWAKVKGDNLRLAMPCYLPAQPISFGSFDP